MVTKQAASYQIILKSTPIIGWASVINILIGLVSTKIIAILLGSTGIGLVSLYTGLMSTATAVSASAIGTIGTRQIAEAHYREINRHYFHALRSGGGDQYPVLAGFHRSRWIDLGVWALHNSRLTHMINSDGAMV